MALMRVTIIVLKLVDCVPYIWHVACKRGAPGELFFLWCQISLLSSASFFFSRLSVVFHSHPLSSTWCRRVGGMYGWSLCRVLFDLVSLCGLVRVLLCCCSPDAAHLFWHLVLQKIYCGVPCVDALSPRTGKKTTRAQTEEKQSAQLAKHLCSKVPCEHWEPSMEGLIS